MSYRSQQRRFGLKSNIAGPALAGLLLPMAPVGSESIGAQDTEISTARQAKTKYPQIVMTSPAFEATDVKASLKEISVTFDRDIGRGMSWTGGPPLFPLTDKSRKPK